MNPDGRELYRYKAGSAIEAQPVVDPRTGEVYFTTVQGTLSRAARAGRHRSLEGRGRRRDLAAGRC